MNLELFAVCESAVERDGYLFVDGICECIRASKMPVVVQRSCIVSRMRFSIAEQGVHKIKIIVIDDDGTIVKKVITNEIELTMRNEGPVFRAWNCIVNVTNLQFEEYGEYTVQLSLDGAEQSSLPLWILPNQD